jgi:molybdenum cofactor cytidylyltransferase
VVAAGGRVLHAGMPVDPGNLLLLGEFAAAAGGVPLIGIPTCARSPKLNGFDFVLRRYAAGEAVTGEDIMAMGVGGLLTEIETRPMLRDTRPRPAAD